MASFETIKRNMISNYKAQGIHPLGTYKEWEKVFLRLRRDQRYKPHLYRLNLANIMLRKIDRMYPKRDMFIGANNFHMFNGYAQAVIDLTKLELERDTLHISMGEYLQAKAKGEV